MGVWFHLVRIMADAGVPEDRLGTVFLAQTVGQMLGKFVFSALLDRLSVHTVLSAAMVVQLGAIGCFVGALHLVQPMIAVAGVALQAAALGGAYSVDGVSYAKFFGRDNLGAITGTTKAVWQVDRCLIGDRRDPNGRGARLSGDVPASLRSCGATLRPFLRSRLALGGLTGSRRRCDIMLP
jgi:hypothetical protein